LTVLLRTTRGTLGGAQSLWTGLEEDVVVCLLKDGEACQAILAPRNMTTTSSFFYITTNLVVRREGGVILTTTTKKMRMWGKRGKGQRGRMRDDEDR